jgi:hypothetical protein
VVYCEEGDEFSVVIKCGEFLDCLRRILNNEFTTATTTTTTTTTVDLGMDIELLGKCIGGKKLKWAERIISEFDGNKFWRRLSVTILGEIQKKCAM